MNTDPNTLVPRPDITSMASDPNTDLETLRTIAFEYPALRAAVALNPATYQGLLDWLGQLGDAGINQALYQRATYGPYYPQATYEQPVAAEQAPEQPTVDDPAVADPIPDPSAPSQPAVDQPTAESTPSFAPIQQTAEATAIYPVATAPADYAPPVQEPSASQPASYAPPSPPASYAPTQQPSYQPPTQPPTPGAYPGPRENNSDRKKLLILGLLALIALVLLGLIYYLISGPGGRQDTDPTPAPTAATTAPATTTSESTAATPSATPTQTSTPTTTPTPTPSAQAQYPAPAGAIEAQLVISPTGNLVCNLTEDDVFCMAKESSGKVGQSCAGSPLVVKTGTESTATSCGQSMPGGSAVTLEYDKPATFGNVACISRYSGLTCWNTVTGNSLAISRAGWQGGSRGEIPEKAFSWNK